LHPAITALTAIFSTVAGARIGGTQPDHLLWVARGAVEHLEHALLGRRHQRQAVRPTALEHRLLLVLVPADLDAARPQAGFVEADFQPFDDPRLDVLGAAARPCVGKVRA
jgi:hypothetical protein